jgi:hypothetical protein
MTRQIAPTVAAILLSSTLAACVTSQGQRESAAPQTAVQMPVANVPSAPSAPDEAAFAVASMPPPPAARPVVKPAWIKRVETQGATDQNGKINMNAASVQPLYQDAGKTDTVFTQVTVASSAQTESPSGTSNVGLGYRKLVERDLMVGLNGFYDRDWAQTIDRTGADAELRWRAFNLAVNYYAAQDDGEAKRPLDGYDIQLGSQVPYLPWAQTTFARSDLFTDDKTVSETYTAGMKLDLVKYLQLEAGVRGDGTNPEAGVVKLNFNLLPSQWGPQRRTAFSSTPISSRPLEEHDLRPATLDKVKRNNAIQTAN